MTARPVFSITPDIASKATPVRLSVPATGYRAAASVTNPCGKPIPGASVSVTGDVATPHLPAGYHGTAYVDWTVAAVNTPGNAKVRLVLASKQVIGHASSCTTGASPYGSAAGRMVTPARPADNTADVVTGGLTCALAAAVIVTVWRRRPGRNRPSRHSRAPRHGM